MVFRYPLTASQYARFQHQTNDVEIRRLCQSAGVRVTDERIMDGNETWYFDGRCSGTMALVQVGDNWFCVIQVRKKPWWLPWFILDWGFQEALK